jgi:hypothetical protein
MAWAGYQEGSVLKEGRKKRTLELLRVKELGSLSIVQWLRYIHELKCIDQFIGSKQKQSGL